MFMSRVRILAALLSAVAAAPSVAQSADVSDAAVKPSQSDEAVGFTTMLVKDASIALTNRDENGIKDLSAFRAVLENALAIDVIGKFMIGSARSEMNQEQLTRYEAVFPAYITALYAEQFQEILGRPMEVIDQKSLNARDTIVRTQFVRKSDDPIQVDWRVRKLRSGELKTIDIIVSGVSIMLVKREEFSSFISVNGVDALIDQLQQQAAS